MIPATAIVVTFDSAHALPDCLDALRADNVPVIVVDNASTDDTVAIAEERQGAQSSAIPATKAMAAPTTPARRRREASSCSSSIRT